MAERDDLNVLFILVDTLRADRLSAYGYERETSPFLAELAETGVRFSQHIGQSSWTSCSLISTIATCGSASVERRKTSWSKATSSGVCSTPAARRVRTTRATASPETPTTSSWLRSNASSAFLPDQAENNSVQELVDS